MSSLVKLYTEHISLLMPVPPNNMRDPLGHADRLGVAGLVEVLHLLPVALNVAVAQPGRVDQVQVDILDAELLETLLHRLFGTFAIRAAPLGREPDLLAVQARLFQRLADFLLVPVG